MGSRRVILAIVIAASASLATLTCRNLVRLATPPPARTTDETVVPDVSTPEQTSDDSALIARQLGSDLATVSRDLGLTVTQLESDPVAQILSFAVTGACEEAISWLYRVEELLPANSSELTGMELRRSAPQDIGISLELQPRTPAATAPNPERSYSESEVAYGASSRTIASAFRTPFSFTPEQPVDGHGSGPCDEPPLTTMIRFVGTVSIAGVSHFALEFSQEKTIRTMTVGQIAFGWRLTAADQLRLILEKEGQLYAIEKPRT